MNAPTPPKTDKDFVRSIEEFFDQVPPPETKEEVALTLREYGHDPADVATRMRAIAEKALAASPLNWRVQARTERLAEQGRIESFMSHLPKAREELLDLARQMMGQGLLVAHHRNFESMSDDDLASLVAEHLYLKEGNAGDENQEPPL